jgi:hypothetical protein
VIEEPAAQAMLSSGTVPFPLLLRPEFSLRLEAPAAPTKAVEVKTAAELGHWMHEFAQARCPVLITRSLLGTRLRQFSVAVARKGGVVRSFVAEKLRPHAQQRAVGTYVRLAPHPAAESLARDLLARMSFEGLAEVEVLTDAAGDPGASSRSPAAPATTSCVFCSINVPRRSREPGAGWRGSISAATCTCAFRSRSAWCARAR